MCDVTDLTLERRMKAWEEEIAELERKLEERDEEIEELEAQVKELVDYAFP